MRFGSTPPSHRQDSAAIDAHGPEWRDWIDTNLRAGCDPDDMAARMAAAGWAPRLAAQALALAQAQAQVKGASDAIARPELPQVGVWEFDGHRVTVTLRLAAPAIAVCENVLTPEECAQLLAYAAERGLQPSTVVDDSDGHAKPHPERTSTGLMLSHAETDLVARIEARLARITGWPVENGEGLQILRYDKGQEYRAHFDAFPGGTAGQVHCASGGQRVCTSLVYLRSPERGGGTSFPNIGLTLRPRVGSAILFHNVDRAGRRANDTLHAGQPVDQGDKVVLTYWQREREFGRHLSG